MLRFRLALIAYSTRLILPFVIAMLAIGGASYLGIVPLNDHGYPGGTALEQCSSNLLIFYAWCGPNSRFAWQIPVGVLIGVVGLGAAAGFAWWNRRHPRARPLPPLPAGWQ
jgi:hypothetical protein